MIAVDYLIEIIDRIGTEGDELDALEYACGSAGSVQQERGDRIMRVIYFEEESLRDAAMTVYREAGHDAQAVDLERRDWLEHYQQSLHALPIGERFVVAPDASLIEDTGRLTIVIPQEHAFGTGSHETTALCLEMLEGISCEDVQAVDIGTGSGILAIGMARLGARSVVAFDNDPEALAVLQVNLIRNGVSTQKIKAFCGGAHSLRGSRFRVATMNIIPEVIVPLLPSVRDLLDADARILFSGILVTRSLQFIEEASRAGFTLERDSSAGEWWCGQFRRSS